MKGKIIISMKMACGSSRKITCAEEAIVAKVAVSIALMDLRKQINSRAKTQLVHNYEQKTADCRLWTLKRERGETNIFSNACLPSSHQYSNKNPGIKSQRQHHAIFVKKSMETRIRHDIKTNYFTFIIYCKRPALYTRPGTQVDHYTILVEECMC